MPEAAVRAELLKGGDPVSPVGSTVRMQLEFSLTTGGLARMHACTHARMPA
eukprot:CAMPEP_0204520002 /NCGR_PEP_ID=MMETSP0661-20131031/5033_1 /ASSEMBLY_ACC=CAM_ASM_000606 /TAXON_ID=109239 /ORGANISM="Alexandrium margalefi, Strain AMGDE01CS-322" /LENGTH=50 /DNA_ID=CAMNT_0051525535 /DNA_START=64 /DNA_END=214 /DNA_ORIENTATION=-